MCVCVCVCVCSLCVYDAVCVYVYVGLIGTYSDLLSNCMVLLHYLCYLPFIDIVQHFGQRKLCLNALYKLNFPYLRCGYSHCNVSPSSAV